jgi:antitoxin (DNA-binding transcriptional repressor) of toxin-antitoxin stability system
MQRVTIAEAERDLSNLVNHVYSEGVSIELERGDKVIARLTPATPFSPVKIGDLNSFLQNLPKLADDAEAFSAEVQRLRREFPTETNPWD